MDNKKPEVIDFTNERHLNASHSITSEGKATNASDPENVQAFISTVKKMTDTFIAKNHDYGDSFSESVKELGPIAGLTPIMHKFNRLKNIIKGNNPLVEGETISDTLLDMANYCIMLKLELERV